MNEMNHLDPAFDPRIADWLEADPDRAPREVLDTVLAAMPSIPQRRAVRAPRRLSNMNRFALMATAAAIVVAVGLGGLVLTKRGPNTGQVVATPSPIAPSPSLPALTKQLTSGKYGYVIRYPDGWHPTLAGGTWLPGTQTLWGDPALDVIQSSDARLVAASQPLGAGRSPDAWYQAYCAGDGAITDACRAYATTWGQIQVGSATGFIDLDGAQASPGTIKPGGPIFDAVIVVDGRGYEFTLDGNVDRALFEHLLGAVSFTPATPSRITGASATFSSPLYGYSIRVDPSWTTKNATVLIDAPSSTDAQVYDDIKVTGTDTTIQGAAWDLAGRTFDQFLADKHQEALGDTGIPENCRGLDVSKWPEVPIGTKTGRQMTLCNYAEFYVESDGKAFTFVWGHETFDTTQHLDMNDLKSLLRTVTFPSS
jgi:hypothetical protein